MKVMDSEYIGSSKILSIDEAKERKGVVGDSAKEFEEQVINKQDSQFKDIMSVVFGWKIQPDGSRKLVSKLPNGKILFPDRSEQLETIEPGIPYICLVYERKDETNPKTGEVLNPGREAFAKICAEEYHPKIYVPSSKMPTMVWRDRESGKIRRKVPVANSYELRMITAIKEMEKLGFPSVRIIFRENQQR